MQQLPESHLASLVTLVGDAIIVIDSSQHVVVFNHAAERMFERPAEEILGRPLDAILPAGVRDLHRSHICAFLRSGEQARFMGERREIAGLRKSGIEFPAEATISRLDVPGAVFLIAILRDVSRRKQDEQALQAALAEKDLMLRELRHRIGNNLQVIDSLLHMQISRTDNLQTRGELQEMHGRVQALNLMYQALGESIDQVAAASYISNLAAHLQSFFAEPANRIAIAVEVPDDILFSSQQATYVGLLINEIVTNSFKHAFPDGRSGTIRIDLHMTDAGTAELTVADDGVGFRPTTTASRERSGLGVLLIDSMAKNLRGRMTVDRTVGTRYAIIWPLA